VRLQAEGRRPAALTRRVNALLDAHAEEWTAPLREVKHGAVFTFRRGFVEEVTMSATRFVRGAAKLFQLAPTVRSARFPDASNEVSGLAKCKHLARLREVDLSRMCVCGGCPIERELARLFASRHVANLTTLNLTGDRIDAEGAERLAASKHLARLTTLDLSNNRIGTEGARALAASQHLDRLAELNLSRNGLDADGAKALAEAPRLAGLTRLVLKGNAIGVTGARALAASPLLARLTVLDLSNNRIGNAGARVLATSPQAAGLKVLNLTTNAIGGDAAEMLRNRFGKRVKV
jgi:hypothetical protein